MTIDEQIVQTQDKAHKKAIALWLKEEIKTDDFLKAACDKPGKTLDGIVTYCKKQAQSQAEDGCSFVPDVEVYAWVKHYILEDSLNCEPEAKKNKNSDKSTEMTDDEAECVDTMDDFVKRQTAKRLKAEKNTEKKTQPAETISAQLSLF